LAQFKKARNNKQKSRNCRKTRQQCAKTGKKKERIERKKAKNEEEKEQKNAVPTPDRPVPKTMKEAKKSLFWSGFEKAIHTEIRALEEKGTWEYVNLKDLPLGTKILRSKIVFNRMV